ncbi:MAG: tyrosine-type recombinase/integrase [Bradyrhizobium sp.]|uniref:tyrosine-type recombinase/integrase n=1 Tax=Bradyrhizobium sp. TaxID=376 RepID=UPI002726139F|nr:site-specific integrase [Bradyrhizobium sp.]MDO8400761.1 tyrosine-type recombinase/integrase [Bradyrhizobium sp.]
MPRLKLTKNAIDSLPTHASDTVYWDIAYPGFGVKVTPKGRKVFVVLYRTGGAGSKLRKYTIGVYGPITLHQARVAAQRVFAAKLEGRDPASEKRTAKQRVVADRVDELLEAFIAQHVSQNRSAREISRILHREVGKVWGNKNIHEIGKRDVVELISAIEQRGAPTVANKTLKLVKTFLRWCVGRAVLDQSPAEGVPRPAKEVARDRVLTDLELVKIILAARTMDGPYGGIVELLALTGQRREEVAAATWDEFDLDQRVWTLPKTRTKNEKQHIVHLSTQAITVLKQKKKQGSFVFTVHETKSFRNFAFAKRRLDDLSGVKNWRLHDLRRTCVSGMARLGIPPHVADKVLNHQSGTISGVAAVYQRHDFLDERKVALDRWGNHVAKIVADVEITPLNAVREAA